MVGTWRRREGGREGGNERGREKERKEREREGMKKGGREVVKPIIHTLVVYVEVEKERGKGSEIIWYTTRTGV